MIGDFTTLSPGVHVAGCVNIGKRVFVGIGATIINGTKDNPLKSVDDVIIAAGACVTHSVPAWGDLGWGPAEKISKRFSLKAQKITLP